MVPKLHFTPAGTNEGFRSAGLAIYSNLDPDTLLREIFQNAVDASIADKPIRIRIRFETIQIRDLPAIADYKRALDEAIETQSELGALNNALNVSNAMKQCLQSEKLNVLWISDNGIGLSPQHMVRLLGDGQSAKQDATNSGAFGNGHITVFPASDLRYLLYGGVSEKEGIVSKIFAGHTILASRQSKATNSAYGKDGYLLQSLNPDDLFDRFEFCDHPPDSPLMETKMTEIEKDFGTGSCVGILGFNHFNRDWGIEDTVKTIERVAAVHFLPLVFEGELELSIFNEEKHIRTVNRDRLHDILHQFKDQRRRRNKSIGPNGRQSWATLDAHERGERTRLETSLGSIRALVLHENELDSAAGGTNIQLFRNGMWITNNVPRNEPHRFQSRQAFTAVLLVEPNDALKACELIRDCEGPRHIDILKERLNKNPSAESRFDAFFNEVNERLCDITPEKQTEEFDPGFLLIDAVSQGKKGGAKGSGSRIPVPQPVGPGGTTGGNGGDSTSVVHRLTKPCNAKATLVVKEHSAIVYVRPLDSEARIALRLKSSDGVDATCDIPLIPTYRSFNEGVIVDDSNVCVLSYGVSDRSAESSETHTRPIVIELGPVTKDAEFSVQIPLGEEVQEKLEPVLYRVKAPKADPKGNTTIEKVTAS